MCRGCGRGRWCKWIGWRAVWKGLVRGFWTRDKRTGIIYDDDDDGEARSIEEVLHPAKRGRRAIFVDLFAMPSSGLKVVAFVRMDIERGTSLPEGVVLRSPGCGTGVDSCAVAVPNGRPDPVAAR